MNIRLILVATIAASAAGLAVPAVASTDNDRSKLCVLGPTPAAPNQVGICIAWDKPLQSTR